MPIIFKLVFWVKKIEAILILKYNLDTDYLLFFLHLHLNLFFSIFLSLLISGALQQHVLSESEGLPEGGVLFPLRFRLGVDPSVF